MKRTQRTKPIPSARTPTAGPSVSGGPREQEMRVEAAADDRRSGRSGHKEDRAEGKIHHHSDDQPVDGRLALAAPGWGLPCGRSRHMPHEQHEQHEQHADVEGRLKRVRVRGWTSGRNVRASSFLISGSSSNRDFALFRLNSRWDPGGRSCRRGAIEFGRLYGSGSHVTFVSARCSAVCWSLYAHAHRHEASGGSVPQWLRFVATGASLLAECRF